MGYVKRRPWNRQPQNFGGIDSIASDGIAALFNPALGAIDLVSGKVPTTFGTQPKITAGKYGLAFDSTAAKGGYLLYPSVNMATAYQTHIVVAEMQAKTGSYQGLFAVGNASASQNSVAFQDSGSGVWAAWNNAGTTSSGIASTADVTPSVWVIGGAPLSTPTAGLYIYRDGVLLNSGPGNAPTVQSDSRLVLMGERSASTTYAIGAKLYLYAGYNRRLSEDEILYRSANPWSIFAPRSIWVPVSAGGGSTAVGLSTETDTALALSGLQIGTAGLASETDSALQLAAVQSLAAGLATEADTAFALAAVQLSGVGLASETDTALALSAGATGSAGVADETDTALALAAVQIGAVGLALETDAALALTGISGTAPGIAAETDTAFALAAVQKLLVGAALEVDTALALSAPVAPGSELALILKILRNRQELNAATGKFTLYDDDGLTVLYESNAWADAAGTVPYSGGILARIDALA